VLASRASRAGVLTDHNVTHLENAGRQDVSVSGCLSADDRLPYRGRAAGSVAFVPGIIRDDHVLADGQIQNDDEPG
jgi:hypothetical protein